MAIRAPFKQGKGTCASHLLPPCPRLWLPRVHFPKIQVDSYPLVSLNPTEPCSGDSGGYTPLLGTLFSTLIMPPYLVSTGGVSLMKKYVLVKRDLEHRADVSPTSIPSPLEFTILFLTFSPPQWLPTPKLTSVTHQVTSTLIHSFP